MSWPCGRLRQGIARILSGPVTDASVSGRIRLTASKALDLRQMRRSPANRRWPLDSTVAGLRESNFVKSSRPPKEHLATSHLDQQDELPKSTRSLQDVKNLSMPLGHVLQR